MKKATCSMLAVLAGVFASIAAEKSPMAEFEEAVKAGEPMKAEKSFRAVVSKNAKQSPKFYFDAAKVAGLTLNWNGYKDRMGYIVRNAEGWDDTIAAAVTFQMVHSADVDAFARLAKADVKNASVRGYAENFYRSFFDQNRAGDLQAMCEAMLSVYNDKEAAAQALGWCYNYRANNRPGFSNEKFQALLDKYPVTAESNAWGLDWMLSTCVSYDFRVDYLTKNKVLISENFFNGRIFDDMWNGKIVSNDAQRVAAFNKLKKLETVLFTDPKNFNCGCYYLNNRCRAVKALVEKGKELEFGKKTMKLWEYLAKTAVADATGSKLGLVRGCAGNLMDRVYNDFNEVDRLRATYPTCFYPGHLMGNGGYAEKAMQKKDGKELSAILAKVGNSYEYRTECLAAMSLYGNAAEATKTLEEYIMRNPQSFSRDTMLYTLNNMKSVSASAKCDFMKRMITKVGYSKLWDGLGDEKQIKNWTGTFEYMKDPAMAGVTKLVKDKVKAEYAYATIWYTVSGKKKYDGDLKAAAVNVLKLYNQQLWPAAKDDKDPIASAYTRWVLDKFASLCYNNDQGAKDFLEVMGPLMSKTSDYWWYYEVCSNRIKGEARRKYLNDRARIHGEGFGDVRLDKDAKEIPAWALALLKTTDESTAYYFTAYNFAQISPEGRVALLNAYAQSRDLSKVYWDWHWGIYCTLNDKKIGFWANKDLTAKVDWESLLKNVVDKPMSDARTPMHWIWTVKQCRGVAEMEKYLVRYMKTLDGLEPCKRLNDYLYLVNDYNILDQVVNAEKGTKDWYGKVIQEKLLPQLKAVKNDQAPMVKFHDGWELGQRLFTYRGLPDIATNAAKRTWIPEYEQEVARLENNFCGGAGDMRSLCQIYNDCFRKAFATTNKLEMVKYAARLGRSWHGWIGGTSDFLKLCDELKGAECWESMFLLANSVPSDADAGFLAAATKMRAVAAPHMPGIYPVGENDPAYPLYVAADELARKNSERAWDLLQKNIPIFEREAMKLPPDFTAWGVEQLRLQRGDKDALLLKARTIATALLANEAALTPELAASMMLVRAESYRDQQNFEAAKLEYQSIRNNKKYEGTKAGRKAMFRQVDLMIDMGGASGAEATLEYWLSQPDTEVQAEAHYFLARIAYERKDFDECIKQLRETFALDFTHTEARFLQGKWKLATNSEVDDTDVMIGTLADRTAIRPGQQLSITVQDRNLSVAGGGASIPVIVTTVPGKDVERVYLYPSARDPNLFKGVVDVKLGKASVSNMVLEVSGEDSVSYVIDPEFLKARGLPLNAPKKLTVIDDAKLEIENETLRPGNPIYVQLEDKDRSLGGTGSEVSVRVSTSSGDVVEAFPLKEVKPYTGIFRGEVPTALPPPRAFASDTAVGFNAGDVINSKKKGVWKSLADGQPGKWLEVDTMGSHMVKKAKIVLPDPESVREIALYGRLGNETIRLGSLPDEPVEKRVGLTVRSVNHQGMRRNADQMRSYFNSLNKNQYWSSVCEKGLFCFPSAKGNQWVPQQLMWKGVFVAPKDVTFARFRVTAKKTQGDTFRNLWISVSIDGEEVLTGQGPTMHGRIASVDLTPGPHELEVYASLGRELDGFDLEVVDDNDEGHPISMDWFDAKKNPEIERYLKSKAEIKRTPEGFVAEFEKAQRLRSLRWEFIKRTTPDVTVEKLEVVTSKDETVIPCETDFTDAQKNNTLEVAPGDKISVAYVDEVTTSGEKRVLERSIKSSFNNAKVGFFFEESVKEGRDAGIHLREAFRFHAGDKMLVGVYDPDQDVSGGADSLVVRVTSSSGEKKDLKLLETKTDYHEFRYHYNQQDETQRLGVHTGLFLGLLRTADPSNTNDVKALKVKSGEALTLSYNDRENTNPGVPFVRQTKVLCVDYGTPKVQLFHTRKFKVIDNSAQAKAKLEKIRRRPGNEQVKFLYRDTMTAEPMPAAVCNQAEPIDVNVATPVPIRVIDPSRARHNASALTLVATAESEIAKAKAEGREPESVKIPLVVGGWFTGFQLKKGGESKSEAQRNGSFNGVLELCLGVPDPDRIARPDAPPQLQVTGSDTVDIKVVADDSKTPLLERKLRFVSNGSIALMDSTWNAERMAAHVGEKFYVSVEDADMDGTEDADTLDVSVKSVTTGSNTVIKLTETLPHSGIFTGTMPSKQYGDKLIFTYNDKRVLPGTELPRLLCVTGHVYSGSDGSVRLFSKRFRDNDAAVLVQFRLAECLFEQAKEHRQLAKKNKDPSQSEKAQVAIAQGKYILEEALKNYPDSQHVVQGEYLLANLYQELGTEQKDAKDMVKATPLFTEALARFSTILSAWPESEFAAKAQYHKALCLEMLGDYPRASEEYVKMTYLYPDSDLVGDATIRLATYYYKQEKRYDIAGRIYENFQKRFPTHEKAPRTLFMSGSCYIKQGEAVQKEYEEKTKRNDLCKAAGDFYRDATVSFSSVAEKYRETASPEMRAQALYWTGDAHLRRRDYQNSYLFLKRTVFEYPETEWARRARGLLLQESRAFDALEAK